MAANQTGSEDEAYSQRQLATAGGLSRRIHVRLSRLLCFSNIEDGLCADPLVGADETLPY